MSNCTQYKREADDLAILLSEMGELFGRQTGFVQRTSRFGGKEFIQVMSLGCLENGAASLNDLCQVAHDLGVPISASGLHQRLDAQAVELLSQVCSLWVQRRTDATAREVLCNFHAVRIFDSSRIVLDPSVASVFPSGRNRAEMKVQLVYEYRRGDIEAIEVETGNTPDQNCELPLALSQAGDLALFDLGFFDQKRLAQLSQKQSYFLTRLQSQVGLYEAPSDHVKLDWLAYLKQLPSDQQVAELKVYLGQKSKVKVRVVCYRVPPHVAQARRRRAKQAAKKRGKSCSETYLEQCDWVIFVTNVPPDLLSLDQISIVYRVRWQIELIFKVWKQEMDWGQFGSWRIERVMAQFWGRCLGLLIFHRLIDKYLIERDWEICWQKAFRLLKRRSYQFIQIVKRNFWGILTFLQKLDSDFRQFARKENRRKSPTTYTLLQAVRA